MRLNVPDGLWLACGGHYLENSNTVAAARLQPRVMHLLN